MHVYPSYLQSCPERTQKAFWSGCIPFSAGLDEISSEKDAHGKAATKASEDSRKTLADNDDDYEPKLTPG